MFADRAEAGRKLAQRLTQYSGQDAIVLALPRGGVVVGYEIARALGLPLDIRVVRKIGHPGDPEYAIGAVDENGVAVLDNREADSIDQGWLAEETARQQKEAQRRSEVYRKGKAPVQIAGKIAILTDDGIATGLTMRLALAAVKAERPQKIVVAVPVAPSDAVQEIKREADVVVLEPPEDFSGAVGAHYERFEQVEDEEVMRLLF